MATILIIDDDPGFGLVLAEVAKTQGHTPSWAITLADGLEMALRVAPDVVFLDVHLPDGNGLEAIGPLKDSPPRPEVIVITGLVDAEGAEQAIWNGAWDYVEKSSTAVQLALSMKRALRFREASSRGIVGLRRAAIIGEGPRLSDALAKVAQAASGSSPVLLSGESGTGKELFARCIHDNSPRAGRELVTVDCAALPETLVESILFGHARGAFTGADTAREGLVKAADGGTLFLDEVGELPLSVQKIFLRVLQERRFRPVGSRAEVQSDFRLVAATNRDLGRMVAEGRFREDLYFRLQAFEISLPPLRERHWDLPLLARYCLKRLAGKTDGRGFEASPELLEELRRYSWPGNVRELFQALEKAADKAGGEQTIFPEHLPRAIRVAAMQHKFGRSKADALAVCVSQELDAQNLPPYREFREQAAFMAEERYLLALFQAAQGRPKRACEISGLSRTRVYCLAKAHGIRTARGE